MKLFCFPSNIEEDILALGSNQVPYCRTPEFSSLVKENEAWLLNFLGCRDGRVIPLTASGTGAMDALIAGISNTARSILVVSGGTFGARWADLCQYYGIQHDVLDVEFGKDLDMAAFASAIQDNAYDAVLMQHHETSSGQLFDIERVGQICKDCGTRLMVDAISSFLADDYRMDGWNVAATILSSHKGLCLPPGLSFVVLGSTMTDEAFSCRSFYFDIRENLLNLDRGQTPYTPAVPLFIQLHERLRRLQAQGLQHHLAEIATKADVFRARLDHIGVPLSAQTPSHAMTGFYVSGNAREAFALLQEKDMIVMPSCRPGLLRASHTGTLTIDDYIILADEIAQWEKAHG